MKKFITGLTLCGACLATVSAFAIPVTFTDITTFTASDAVDIDHPTEGSNLKSFGSGDVNYIQTNLTQALAGEFDYVSWTHQFSFDPVLDHIVSGSLSLNIRDDQDSGWFNREYAFGYAEDGTWGFGEVDTGSYDFDVTASFLEDGLFSVTLASILGDFYLDSSSLTVTYEPLASANVSVPEPSTLAIMGGSLILLGLMQGVKRRKLTLDFGNALS